MRRTAGGEGKPARATAERLYLIRIATAGCRARQMAEYGEIIGARRPNAPRQGSKSRG